MDINFSSTTYDNRRRTSDELEAIAKELRRDIIKMLAIAKSGHSGGPLGTADIYAVLYFNGIMNFDAKNPAMPNRDRFVLSPGHMCPVLYASLANAGFFPKSELATLRKFGTRLQGHPGRDTHLPGIETSSGSLGQGVSIAVGMAMADKLLDRNDACVYSLTGDGELQEGSVWEAAMAASNFGLDNFCWIIDNNDCQIDGRLHEVMNVYPITDKFVSFGFDVVECDGHNYDELTSAFEHFKKNHRDKCGKPTAIVAHTKMGRDVSFMEDNYKWHGMPPNAEQAAQALKELI